MDIVMTEKEYRELFKESSKNSKGHSQEFKEIKEADTRAGRALTLALDLRKFEIELYWKRATYFWGFIATAFAGYAITYKTVSDQEPWLNLLFSSLGLIFSWAWFLVNRGSKFWQQNWEGHVDLLEDLTIGPLYKTLAVNTDPGCCLTAAGKFSVTKINQLLSFFVTIIWAILFIKALMPISKILEPDYFKLIITAINIISMWIILHLGRSSPGETKIRLDSRKNIVEHPKSAGIEWDIFNQKAESLHTVQSYDRAKVVAQKALEIAEQNVGPDHLDVASSLDTLAMIYKSLGDNVYESGLYFSEKPHDDHLKAEAYYNRSITIREKVLGTDHLDVAASLDRLALLYQDRGYHYCNNRYIQIDYTNEGPPDDYLKAEILYKRSLTIREKALGPYHLDVATSLDRLAMLYKTLSKFSRNGDQKSNGEYTNTYLLDENFKVEAFYERSLIIKQMKYGQDSTNLLNPLGNLYTLFRSNNDNYRANLYRKHMSMILQKAKLEESEKTLGPDNPKVAQNLTELANLYFAQNDYAKAEPLYIRSLEILEKTPDPDHPDVATTLEHLAALYRVTNRESEAADIEQHVAHIHAMKK